jgi:excisionase family DNA binding protein
MSKTKEILTAKDVAEYLSIHTLTVHRYARQGKIPAFKIGSDWRFHKKAIDRWIKDKSSMESWRRQKQGAGYIDSKEKLI